MAWLTSAGGVVEVTGGFDFAIAKCSDLFQGVVEVFGQLLADTVELEAERDAEGLRLGEEAAGLGSVPRRAAELVLRKVSSGVIQGNLFALPPGFIS